MTIFWKAILAIAIVDSIYYNRYFVSGAQNKSCVTNDDSCSVCCLGQECVTTGYFQNDCKNGCIDGHRGNRCYELCTYNCKNCDNNIDICQSCFDGFYLGDKNDCKSQCLATCKECSSGISCTSCKEGFHNKYGSSDCRYSTCPTKCVCNEGKCKACMPGFYDISNLCTSRCPSNCLECFSVSQCSSCKDGFFNKNGHETCSYSCSENCTICSSYDVCLQCKPGKFGKQCQHLCSVGCKNNVCEIGTGKCNCSNNFSGESCTKCVSGKYGILCENNCSNNCNNAICGKTHAECTEGCKSDTMTGIYCENCVVGKYGVSCDDYCPEKCLNGECGKENGTCTYGCKEGFKGLSCLECVKGKYGDECYYDCPDRCKNHECEKQFGHCFNCTGNFDGNTCDICKPGFYGSGCDSFCSSKCLNATCDRDSGKCIHGCEDNYSGDKCCVNSENCLLCESNTICQKCLSGYYGQTCNQTCSKLCIKNICEMNTGICTEGCEKSFQGLSCLGCVHGKYGDECNYDCPDRCKNHECDKQSGHCFNCTGNFDGNVCDICKPGFFGSGCDHICSSRCRNATCDKDSGKCMHGCPDNYFGDTCCVSSENCSICKNNSICQKCSPGYYGQTCNQTCSVLCIKNVCEMNTGICTEGCKASSKKKNCLRNQGNTQDDTKLDFKYIIIAAVGGATFTLCMLILIMKIKKFLFTRRSHEDTMVLNHIEGSKTEIKNVSNEDKPVVKGNEPYERLGGDRLDMDDHKYGSANVLEIASRETDDLETYVNLQI